MMRFAKIRRARALAMAAALIATVTLASTATAMVGVGTTCKNVQGHYTSTVLPPETCGGFCTTGTLFGALHGAYTYRMSTMMPTDPTTPASLFYTGTSHLDLGNAGSLVGTDTGIIDQAGGRQAAMITITDGADGLEGSTGWLILRGSMDASGNIAGDYTGEVCTPAAD